MPAKPTKKTFNETAAESAGRRLLAELGRFDCDENACMQLIEKGADLNVRDSYNNTALTLAAWICTDIALALIEQGADVNAFGAECNTALHLAACNGRGAVVTALIKRGAQLDARDGRDGNTPLIDAVSQGHADIAKALVNAGADVTVRNRRGVTAANYAERFVPELSAFLEAAEVRQGFANADRAGTPRKRKIRRRTGGISIKP